MNIKYLSIYNMEHHTSLTHPRMSIEDRAAQFAPFAALTGYEETIKETARHVDFQPILSEDEIQEIEKKLENLRKSIGSDTKYEVRYFKHDAKKEGGEFRRIVGVPTKIDEVNSLLYFGEDTIKIGDIMEIN